MVETVLYCETGDSGVMVSIDASQALDPGSIPGCRTFLFNFLFCYWILWGCENTWALIRKVKKKLFRRFQIQIFEGNRGVPGIYNMSWADILGHLSWHVLGHFQTFGRKKIFRKIFQKKKTYQRKKTYIYTFFFSTDYEIFSENVCFF